ncbi:MAG: diguanylate cyclase, partial [Solirubrobacteraceae bacterium]|nr:diguanylate cyclase [Solirubrobacteraceae bacterium]
IESDQTVVRQGGDEFCVLLPQSTSALAVRTTNALRAALAGVGDGVTAGYGIATYPDDAVTADVLMHVADARLRDDKAGGPPRGGGVKPGARDETDEPEHRVDLSA